MRIKSTKESNRIFTRGISLCDTEHVAKRWASGARWSSTELLGRYRVRQEFRCISSNSFPMSISDFSFRRENIERARGRRTRPTLSRISQILQRRWLVMYTVCVWEARKNKIKNKRWTGAGTRTATIIREQRVRMCVFVRAHCSVRRFTYYYTLLCIIIIIFVVVVEMTPPHQRMLLCSCRSRTRATRWKQVHADQLRVVITISKAPPPPKRCVAVRLYGGVINVASSSRDQLIETWPRETENCTFWH